MLKITVTGVEGVVLRLRDANSRVKAELKRTVIALVLRLESKVKREKLSGQVLNVRSGNLRASIFHQIKENQYGVIGSVHAGRGVPYARIHEYGGHTKAHIIEPSKAKVLAFTIGDKTVFAKRVNHPGSRIPERSYLRSSLREMKNEIETAIAAAVKRGMKK